jgi:hypothetical protein
MASKVQICNLALTRIGASTITSLSDGTRESNLCNTIYDSIAEEVMSEGEWSVCTFRTTLNQTTNTPTYDYTYEYQLPTNPRVLKFIEISGDRLNDLEYDIEEDKLLTNESTVKCKYVGFLEDTSKYGPYLKKAIISRLAQELSYTITGSSANSDRLYQRYQKDLDYGLALDGQQGSGVFIYTDDLTKVR